MAPRPSPTSAKPAPHQLVTLDLNLPRRCGMDVLKELRAHPAVASMAVAIFSSSSSPGEQAAIEEYDNVQFYTKPPTVDEFLNLGAELGKLLKA